jgi:beta-N-acetylhexosaminidase
MTSPTAAKAMIVAFPGAELTAEQQAFFKDINPFGYALFLRKDLGNIQNPAQVRRLTDQLREISGREDVPIALDQEGGRVQRLREPHWPEIPAARVIGDLYHKNPDVGLEAAKLHTRVIASALRGIGANTVFGPCADLITDGTHNAIGDRGFSIDKDSVITLVTTVVHEFLKGGIIPTLKHIPGYGQVDIDPHLALPEINASNAFLQDNDFYVFREIIRKLPADSFYGMNAHVKYNGIDPDHISTFSKIVTHDITRGAAVGFKGLLIADAVEMNALGGTMDERCRKFWDAGGDVALHCTGKEDEIAAIAQIAPDVSDEIWFKQKEAESIRYEEYVYKDDDAHDLARQLLALLHTHDVQWAINKISPSN